MKNAVKTEEMVRLYEDFINFCLSVQKNNQEFWMKEFEKRANILLGKIESNNRMVYVNGVMFYEDINNGATGTSYKQEQFKPK